MSLSTTHFDRIKYNFNKLMQKKPNYCLETGFRLIRFKIYVAFYLLNNIIKISLQKNYQPNKLLFK